MYACENMQSLSHGSDAAADDDGGDDSDGEGDGGDDDNGDGDAAAAAGGNCLTQFGWQ